MTEIKTTSFEVTFNGEKLVIHKLKAGKYYEAQRIYIGLISSVRESLKDNASIKAKIKKEKDLEKVDLKELAEEGNLDFDTLYAKFPQEIAGLVGFCVGIEKEKLLEEAYPEEITEMAEKVIKLNNFAENIKNSVAPLASLGATKV
jgi:hypothetical protein